MYSKFLLCSGASPWTVMPPRQSVPRIHVDFSDSSPCCLSPSSTLDIKDVLGRAKLLPKLIAEDFVFDNTEDAPYFEDGRLTDFPSFPVGRQPPLFILNPHRAGLPFPIRPDAFELGDFCRDEEDACPLLTAPTVPRMKMIMKEQLYVQKWVDALTPDNPPKHVPWTCEKPSTKRKWISEGSIFPADMVKYDKSSTEQRGAVQEHSHITYTNRFSAPAGKVTRSRELCELPDVSARNHTSMESHMSAPHIRAKSADVDTGILRGEPRTLLTPHRIVRTRTSQAPSTLTSPSSGSTIVTTTSRPDAPLAARRGKSLSGLKLNGCVVEHLEYPDIPTAFRGSPIVWSPQFETFPCPLLPNHESMLLDLKSKCAALGSGVSAYLQEPPHPQTKLSRTSRSVDEWGFTQGLATFDNNFLEPTDSLVPRRTITSTGVFLPDDPSTPALQSPGNHASDPPGVPLPPRPVLINPSTPPYVRGILKKVKNVRFQEMSTKESEDCTSPVGGAHSALPERPLPLRLAVPSERPSTSIPNTAKLSNGLASIKETPGRNIPKNSTPRARLPPRWAKANEQHEPTHLNTGNVPDTSRRTAGERSRRVTHAKKSAIPAAVPHSRQKGLSITEIDVRRGIEGSAKGRLSTPLRNIFRFR